MSENQLYFAPMEGITGSIYRRAHHRIFGGVDRYYAPFIFTNPKGKISKKDLLEIAPEYNEGCRVVPQLLSNCAEDFIATAHTLKGLGYDEVNLNLGCPSSTVASKGRGSGFLGEKEALKAFLADIFDKTDMKISLKTRIGLNRADEFDDILDIYQAFPVEMLIVHPRIRMDYYSGKPDMEAFEKASARMPFPVCYNGDIFTISDYETLCGDYPELDRVMLGRGIISNPGLLDRIAAGTNSDGSGTDKETLKRFHQMIYEGYRQIMSGDRNVLFKMKELWACMIQIFSDNGKYIKRIKKSQRLEEYETAAAAVFRDLDILEGAGFRTY